MKQAKNKGKDILLLENILTFAFLCYLFFFFLPFAFVDFCIIGAFNMGRTAANRIPGSFLKLIDLTINS